MGGKNFFFFAGWSDFLIFRICCGMSTTTEGSLMLGFVYLGVPVSQIPLANHSMPARNTCTYRRLWKIEGGEGTQAHHELSDKMIYPEIFH